MRIMIIFEISSLYLIFENYLVNNLIVKSRKFCQTDTNNALYNGQKTYQYVNK